MQKFPWMSICLLLLANVCFGFFLQDYESAKLTWILAIVYIVLECGALSIAWQPVRDFMLLGFKSDVGYTLMAFAGASFVVVMLAWLRIFSYFLLILAAAILLRVDLYTRRTGSAVSFLVLLISSAIGLALSWLPTLIKTGQLAIALPHL
jgi:hypothetical protein